MNKQLSIPFSTTSRNTCGFFIAQIQLLATGDQI